MFIVKINSKHSMRSQLMANPHQRKSKIQLTCRLSAQKLPANKENIMGTPPKHMASYMQNMQCHESFSQNVNPRSPNLSVKTVSKPDLPKKTKRRQSMLQIDIDCIEDEYSKKKVIYQDTPLFASVDKGVALKNRSSRESVSHQDDKERERASLILEARHQCKQLVLTEEQKPREKYSYDNLINAIKINYRNQGSIEQQIRQRISPMLIRQSEGESPLSSHHSAQIKRQRSLYNTNQTVKDHRIVKSPPQFINHSTRQQTEQAMEQLRKVKDDVNKLRDILKVNAKVCQMVYLIDDLERELAEKEQRCAKTQVKEERYQKESKPYENEIRQIVNRNSCEAVEIQNSKHFQSIHHRYNSKQQLNSSKLLKKFNTESEQIIKSNETNSRNVNTKSPFRQIMNYMNRRR